VLFSEGCIQGLILKEKQIYRYPRVMNRVILENLNFLGIGKEKNFVKVFELKLSFAFLPKSDNSYYFESKTETLLPVLQTIIFCVSKSNVISI